MWKWLQRQYRRPVPRSILLLHAPLLILAGLITHYLLRVVAAQTTEFDDAYMFIRYADNLLAGHGYSWNASDGPAFGCTSIPYTFLVALLRMLFPAVAEGTLLVRASGAMGLLAFFLLVLACRAAVSHRYLASLPWLSVFLAYTLLDTDLFLAHARTGMDTTLSLAANALLLAVLFTWTRWGGPWGLRAAALAGYFAFLARPDNGLYGMLLPPLVVAFGFRSGFRQATRLALGLLVLLALDTAVKFWIFGEPLPLTFYAKHGGLVTSGYLGLQNWNPARYLGDFLTYLAPFVVAIALFAGRPDRPLLAAIGLPLSVTLAYFFTVVQVMGFDFRFYFPSLPMVVVPALACLNSFLVALDGSRQQGLRALALRMAWVLPLLALAWTYRGDWARAYAEENLRLPAGIADGEVHGSDPVRLPAYPPMDWWEMNMAMAGIGRKLPSGTRVAASEHGFLAARNPHLEILDLVGLHDRTLAHQGYLGSYLEKRSPEIIWLPHLDYASLRRELKESPSFRAGYEFIPDALNYGVAVRRDHPELLAAVRASLDSIYARR